MEESIYNLIPREERAKPKPDRYVSQYAGKARQEARANKQGGKTMGPGRVAPNSAKSYLRKGASKTAANRVQTMGKPPTPKQPMAKTKPPVPRHNERPVMGMKTKRNYVKDNHVAATTQRPPQKPTTLLDVTAKGATARVDPAKSGLVPTYSKAKGYGQVPEYLTRRREEEDRAAAEYHDYVRTIQQQNSPYEVSENERLELLDGLRTNWDTLHKEYLGMSMVADTGPKKMRKERVEKQLAELERDIQLIERHPVIYVTQ
jgi:hypothetical protein